jgi:hypothetical protein
MAICGLASHAMQEGGIVLDIFYVPTPLFASQNNAKKVAGVWPFKLPARHVGCQPSF